jgi:HTH-type transcriptional regulator, glycine betaine synthesis regulator
MASSKLSPPASRLSPGEAQIIAIFVKMAQTLGAPRSLGEIYGLLFATPQPLSFQDIYDRLELSKGSVSQGLRFLRTVGAIQPVAVEGERREYFEPVVELRALVGGFLKERINPQLAEWGVRAKALKIGDFEVGEGVRGEGLEARGEGDNPSELSPRASGLLPSKRRKTLEGRIDKLKTWQKRANTVLPMIGKLLG